MIFFGYSFTQYSAAKYSAKNVEAVSSMMIKNYGMFANMYQSYELYRDNNADLYKVTEDYHQKINGIAYTFLDKI